MKLSDWADRQGISYLTAYRWFRNGQLPVKAYQSESGTIIVQDDSEILEQQMAGNATTQNNDAISLFVKKTVEFSKNNASVEEFAAFILSNFTLKVISGPEIPKYSRNKPKSEEVQKHFQKFIPAKGEKPKPSMFVAAPDDLDALVAQADDLTTQELVEEIKQYGSTDAPNEPEVKDLIKDLAAAISPPAASAVGFGNPIKTYGPNIEGVFTRSSVDLTPQQLTYTSDTDSKNTLDSLCLSDSLGSSTYNLSEVDDNYLKLVRNFMPTQKEIEAAEAVNKVLKNVENVEKPRRGRPSKNRLGKKE